MKTIFLAIVLCVLCAVSYAETTEAPEAATDIETAARVAPAADVAANSPTVVTCQQGNLSRTVEIVYTNPSTKAPCEVHYKKTVEQAEHDEVLWSAEYATGYCEARMQEFVEKLKGLAWNCR